MKLLTELELEKIEKAKDPNISIHLLVHQKYKKLGYEQTQSWIKEVINNWNWDQYLTTKAYLLKRIEKNKHLEEYKRELLKIVLSSNFTREIEEWVNKMNKKGISKRSIFEILSELFTLVQYHPETNNEKYADDLADILDCFTSWGGNYKILPHEPDLDV